MFAMAFAFILLVAAYVFYLPSRQDVAKKSNDVDVATKPAVVDAAKTLPEGWVNIGGVARPKSDVQVGPKPEGVRSASETLPQGFSKALSPDTNPQVRSVHDALQDRSKPSRFSSFAPAERFDIEEYKKDPSKYLGAIEPSRVFAPAEPGEGVPVLRASGKRYHRVTQGESVRLSVEAEPNAAVTFFSENLGVFSSQLTSETVQADEKGIATAVFTADGGTVDAIKILAASPMASGQVSFLVNVKLPN
jgi:hypothetical protein